MKGKGILFLLAGLLLGVALGAVVLLSGPGRGNAAERRLPPTVGSAVRDFELPVLDGDSQKISALKGTPLVINFWATWCAPCKEEMPLLQRYAEKYAGRVAFLGVDYAEDEPVIRSFVKDAGITFPILLDRSGLVSDLYYVRNFPTTFFVDAEGVLRAQHLGLLTDEWMGRYMKTIGIEP